MSSRFLICCLLSGMFLLQSGCALFEPTKDAMKETMRMFRLHPSDYRDMTEEENDEWDAVGKEARGNRPIEKQGDPLWNWARSEKAASIERNLGFD